MDPVARGSVIAPVARPPVLPATKVPYSPHQAVER
jgi:hypothetical protein